MKNIRWSWVSMGGFVAEIMIFAIAIPIAILVGEIGLTGRLARAVSLMETLS